MTTNRSLILAALCIAGTLIYSLAPSVWAAPNLLEQFPVRNAVRSKPRGGAFPSVSKAQLTGALDARNLALLNKSVGKTALCIGVVDKVYAPKNGAMVLLNMAPNYKTALVGMVRARDFRQFPNLQLLKGKRVALRGKIVSYRGKPEIELTAPGAIQIVK